MSNSYDDVMARRSDIMRRALALDYDSFPVSYTHLTLPTIYSV